MTVLLHVCALIVGAGSGCVCLYTVKELAPVPPQAESLMHF